MTLNNKLQVPTTLNFDPARAMELANLIWLANVQYDENKQNKNPWQNGTQIVGSNQLNFNAPTSTGDGTIQYNLLSSFWFTEVAFLELSTVPFGFIVERVIQGKIEIFIVFRGTREKAEWIDNTEFDQVPFLKDDGSLGKVSRGFNKIFTRKYDDLFGVGLFNPIGRDPLNTLQKRSIQQTILDTLEQCPVDAEIYITGHSLGGALATLATLSVVQQTNLSSPILYSFASPRVGNKMFAEQFDGLDCYRIANSEDLVPTVPPATSDLVGDEIKKDQTLSIAEKNRLDALDSLRGLFSGTLLKQDYEHVGYSLYFTDHRGSVSFNHNLEQTYRQAIS